MHAFVCADMFVRVHVPACAFTPAALELCRKCQESANAVEAASARGAWLSVDSDERRQLCSSNAALCSIRHRLLILHGRGGAVLVNAKEAVEHQDFLTCVCVNMMTRWVGVRRGRQSSCLSKQWLATALPYGPNPKPQRGRCTQAELHKTWGIQICMVKEVYLRVQKQKPTQKE